MTKKTNAQLATQQSDTVNGIDIRPLSGRDFQPVGESNYGWAQARIINPDDYQVGDQIQFSLSGCNAHVYGSSDLIPKPVDVSADDHTADLKFQVPDGTKAGTVTVRATLQRDPRVSGTRDFTFIEVPIATPIKLGCVMVGNGLTVSDTGLLTTTGSGSSSYTLPVASVNTLGGVKQGKNVSIDSDGTLSVAASTAYTLPTASAMQKGGIEVGAGLSMSGDKMSVTVATASVIGGVKQGGSFVIANDGTLTVNAPVLTGQLSHATSSDYGTAKPGTGITSNNGVFSVDTSVVAANLKHASATDYGVVQVGTGITSNNGVLSVAQASTLSAGIVQLATGGEVSEGAGSCKAVTPADIKAVYAPLANPVFTGKAAISGNQLTDPPAARELVTNEYLNSLIPKSALAPKFYEFDGSYGLIQSPFISGSTWILSSDVWEYNIIHVGYAASLEVRGGDWFTVANSSFSGDLGVVFFDPFIFKGKLLPAGKSALLSAGMSCKAFWSDKDYWVLVCSNG